MQISQDAYKSGIYPRSLEIYPQAVRMHLIHSFSFPPHKASSHRSFVTPPKSNAKPNAKPLRVTKVGDTVYDEPLDFPSISACLRYFRKIPKRGKPKQNIRMCLERWASAYEVKYTFIK